MMGPIDPGSVSQHFDAIADEYDQWKRKNAYYYGSLKRFVNGIVRPGSKVLEIGTATGEILAATQPALGVGVDISPRMVDLARSKFPHLQFAASALEDFQHAESFDYIILVDVLDHVHDVMETLEHVHRFCHPGTKVVLTTINPWWEPVLSVMEKLKAKMPEGPHNFVERRNLTKFIECLDFSISHTGYLLLFPKYLPLLSWLANTVGVRTWGVNKLSFVHTMVLRPVAKNETNLGLGCSVVVPCYNEEDNIEEAVRRIPRMGTQTEIIIVNDGSTDKTAEVVRGLLQNDQNLRYVELPYNRGKGFAVQQGFDAATQEVLMIVDADMSVMPEELPRFFNLLNKGICDFVNGTRMVYPMQKEAMRFLNLFGNKVFGLIMTFITGQHLTDTLCGTKAMYKKDYQDISMGMDRWGDFDLLFGAAKARSRMMEVPVHYMRRRSGESKMRRFRHGVHLLGACVRGFREIVLRG